MDLADIVKGAAEQAKASTPAGESRAKARELYDRMVGFVDTEIASASPPIRGGFVRASAIADMLKQLPRFKMSSSFKVFEELGEKPTPGAQATFDAGHAAHWWFQNKYLGPMGELYGEWRCLRCATVEEGVMPVACESCGGERFIFDESWVGDESLRYRGHPDGLLVPPGNGGEPTALLEIKTCATATWDRLTAPMEDHRVQTHAYMRSPQQFKMEDDGTITAEPWNHGPFKECYFVYIDKGKQATWRRNSDGSFSCTSPPRWKVFHIFFDDLLWGRIESKLEELWAVHDDLKGPVDALGDIV